MILLVGAGCTDRRPPDPAPAVRMRTVPTADPRSFMERIAEVRFQNADTEVLAMTTRNEVIALTGRPFGYMHWNVGADPETPRIVFAASDQIDTFAPKGKWVVDWYASGAVGLFGNYGFLSGTAGLSVISVANTHSPTEVLRIPDVDPNTTTVDRDEAYIYRAIVAHPSASIVYGFREQDFAYTLSVGAGGVQIAAKSSYGANGELVCCVRGATVFRNRIYIAFTSRLVWFDIGADGRLRNPGAFNGLQAYNVTSTANHLIVQHEPTRGQPEGFDNPRGVYWFDATGEFADFVPWPDDAKPDHLATDPSGNYLYSSTGVSVDVFRVDSVNRR